LVFDSVLFYCFKVNIKQLISDILCHNLKLIIVIYKEYGFNVVVDSPRLVEPPHLSPIAYCGETGARANIQATRVEIQFQIYLLGLNYIRENV